MSIQWARETDTSALGMVYIGKYAALARLTFYDGKGWRWKATWSWQKHAGESYIHFATVDAAKRDVETWVKGQQGKHERIGR